MRGQPKNGSQNKVGEASDIEGIVDRFNNRFSPSYRMRVYREQTEPLIAYYRKGGVLVEVDGMGSIEEIAKAIEEALGS